MRKIERRIRDAFWSGYRLTIGNTRCTGDNIYLFNNLIIRRKEDGIWATMAGWPTVTTRSRINNILGDYCSVYRNRGIDYLILNGTTTRLRSMDWFKVC